MIERPASGQSDFNRAFIIVLSLAAVAGWGIFAFSSRSSAEVESQLRGQVSSLHQIQMQLLSERSQMQAATGDLEQLRAQVTALREESSALTHARDQAQAEFAAARSGLNGLLDQMSQARNDVSTTGAIAGKVANPQQLVAISAQKTLSKLGYGPLVADGVLGSGSRRAIEAFQRDNGLTVTSELDVATLRRLRISTETAAKR
jgi:chromosome segregation ATPase